MYPYLFFIPVVTSVVLLVALHPPGGLRRSRWLLLVAACAVAALLQFRGGSIAVVTLGLVVQCGVAIILVVRFRAAP